MAIFTRPASQGGKNVIGHRIECHYQSGKDSTPKPIAGIVESQRKIDGKGNLLVIRTEHGFKSVYFERTINPTFYSVRTVRNTDDGYDALRDRRMELYGTR
jgi:hypothetical protein